MKALLITPEKKSVEAIDIGSHDDIKAIIGFDTIESDAVGDAGDRLFFDEECFLRGGGARFQVDTLIPVSGKALVVGIADDGKTLRDVSTPIDGLRSRIKYL